MTPDFSGAIFQRDQGDLQVKYPSATDLEITCQLYQSLSKSLAWIPDIGAASTYEAPKEIVGIANRRRPTNACRMRHHTPKLGNAWEWNPPPSGVSGGPLNGLPSSKMLGSIAALRVNEQV
jgi:hypothetical protein